MAPVRARGRWVVEHRLVLATGLAAALPVIVSTVRAVANGWLPIGDDAIIAVRSYDVLTTHTPLLGQYSASSGLTRGDSHSLGPMLYWLLALPARLGGPTALVGAMGLVNTASVMGVVALARRRGGVALMVAAAVGCSLVCASVSPETIHSIWNPSAAQMPFALLILLCWSLACGEYRLLPLTVLVASFVAQAHLTYLPPTAGLVGVALAGLAASQGWVRSSFGARPAVSGPRREPGGGIGRSAAGSARRWVRAALVVGVICWSGPLVEQATHWPGNLVLVAGAAVSGEAKLGPSAGWHAAVRAVGVPPWWLRRPQDPVTRLGEVVSAPSVLATLSALLVVAGLVLVLRSGVRRRRLDLAAAGAIGLVLCGGVAMVAAATPKEGGLVFTVGYTLRWASAGGMWIWLALGWSLATLAQPLRRFAGRRSSAIAPLAGLAVAVAVGASVAAGLGPDLLERRYEPTGRLVARLHSELPRGSPALVDATLDAFDFQAAAVYELRRRGAGVLAPNLARQLGGRYGRGRLRYEQVVRIASGSAAPSGARVLARLRGVAIGTSPQARVFTVTLRPARAGG